MQRASGWWVALFVAALFSGAAHAQSLGENMIEAKIELPNGAVYMKGETDPVADLVVKLTLRNKTDERNTSKVPVTHQDAAMLSEDDIKKIRAMGIENMDTDKSDIEKYKAKLNAYLDSKVERKDSQQARTNKTSLGHPYVEPELGPHETITFIIKKLPNEGEADAAGEAPKPVRIPRDYLVAYTDRQDAVPVKYLAPGATTEPFTLPVGKFYKITEPGRYSVQAVLHFDGDTQQPDRLLTSNEETFQVLPFKKVQLKVRDLTEWWEEFERGHPTFDYMVYQLERAAPYQEIYYTQKVTARDLSTYEWHRLCSVDPKVPVQIGQLNPKAVAILAKHYDGSAALYTVDFSHVEPKVTTTPVKVEGDALPTLNVEGGKASVQ